MKIYRFNPATGVYLGEDFADETPPKNRDCMLPDDATTIPPPRVERGQMPVFHIGEQRWEILPIPAARTDQSRGKLDEGRQFEEFP